MWIGVRVPFYIVSPWTRGNCVLTEHADHNSQILFIEEWLTVKGYDRIRTDEMVAWRRAHMSNLINALDFGNVCSNWILINILCLNTYNIHQSRSQAHNIS